MGSHRFYFVQVTDTHLGSRRNFRRTEAVIQAINRLPLPVAFVVHTGDIMYNNIDADSVARAGRQVFASLQMPIHFIPGNHDILPTRLETTRAAYREHFGERIYSLEYGDVYFVFLDTGPLAGSYGDELKVLDQLQKMLREARKRPAIIFAHHPPEDALASNGHFDGGWPQENRRRWVDLLNDYNVKAVISGHYHREGQLWLGRVPLYVAGSIGSYPPPSFRLYEYDNGQLGFWTGQIVERSLYRRIVRKCKKHLALS